MRWEAGVAPGARLTVRNLNGNVRVEGGDTDAVIVRGQKSWRVGDPDAITIRPSRYGTGGRDVLLCAEWDRATLACNEHGYAVNNDARNDARLDLVVTVPRRMQVSAETINGDVSMTGLAGQLTGSVVNGNVAIAVGGDANADLAIHTLNGTFRSDLALPLRQPVARGTTRVRLGSGGRSITFATVNGTMRLTRQ